MKLTINSTPLKTALARAANILATRTTVPILETVLLKADADTLTVEATDQVIRVVETLACNVYLPGSLCVGGKTLADMVGNMPSGTVDIELADSGRVRLKSGAYKAALPTLEVDKFPVWRSDAALSQFVLPASLLRAVIKKIGFAQGSDTTRTYLNGVHLHVVADPERLLCFVATDGVMMAISRQAMPEGAASMPGIILPMTSVAQIAKIIGDVEGDLKIAASQNMLEIQIGAITFGTKLVDGTYPQYQRLIPAGHSSRLRLMKTPILEALGLVAVLQGKAVKLAVSETEVIVSGAEENKAAEVGIREEKGEASVTLVSGQMELEGAPIEIGVWLRNLRNIVGATDGDVELLMTDPLGPLMLKHCDDPSVLYVTMPYRV